MYRQNNIRLSSLPKRKSVTFHPCHTCPQHMHRRLSNGRFASWPHTELDQVRNHSRDMRTALLKWCVFSGRTWRWTRRNGHGRCRLGQWLAGMRWTLPSERGHVVHNVQNNAGQRQRDCRDSRNGSGRRRWERTETEEGEWSWCYWELLRQVVDDDDEEWRWRRSWNEWWRWEVESERDSHDDDDDDEERDELLMYQW